MSEMTEIVDLLRWMAEHDVTMKMTTDGYQCQLTLRQEGIMPLESSAAFDPDFLRNPYYDGAILGTLNRAAYILQQKEAEMIEKMKNYAMWKKVVSTFT
jgi:hypothetical protein